MSLITLSPAKLESSISSRKYEPEKIDLEDLGTPLTWIVRLTGKNKSVLEIGPWTGYMTRILCERGNNITCIEINPQAGGITSAYCDRMITGDIEDLNLDRCLEGEKFDVIICGDVLEHLKNPEDILIRIKGFLKPSGYLIASIPNMGHGDVILNLMMQDFDYRPKGLLDQTHLRFFTFESIKRIFFNAGYAIDQVELLKLGIGGTELGGSLGKAPPEIVDYIKRIPFADTYQFIIKARQKDGVEGIELPVVDTSRIAFYEIEGLEELRQELEEIRSSSTWKAVTRLDKFLGRLMPTDTRRGRLYWYSLSAMKMIVNRDFSSLSWRFKYFLLNHVDKTDYHRTVESTVQKQPTLHDGTPGETSRVAVITVTYNSEKTIGNLLDSVLKSNYPAGLIELIIVDNSSSDKTLEIARSYIKTAGGHRIRLVENDRNYGFGKGVNIGLEGVECDYIFLLNPDCSISEDTIAQIVSAANRTRDNGFRLWEARQKPFEHPKIYNPVTLETTWSSGACCLICREAFNEIGGFDENIFLYLEDVDLSWRLRMKGHSLMYLPGVAVTHDTYESERQVKAAQYYNSTLNQFYLRYKFGRASNIFGYYLFYIYLVLKRPAGLPGERGKLLKNFFNQTRYIPKALSHRIKDRGIPGKFKPIFSKMDFEVHREGAFLKPPVDSLNLKNPPKVSVIVRTVGNKSFLMEALACLRNQTYSNFEVVVVEDGPETVGSFILEKFPDLDIKYSCNGSKLGRCHAGNKGLAMSTGEYVCFLDEDDLLFADYLETMVSFIVNNKNHRLFYSLAFEVPTEIISKDPLKYVEYDYRVVFNEEFNRDALMDHNFIPIQCAIFDRCLFEDQGGFDTDLEYLEDWDLWIRYSQATSFSKIPKVLSLYRVPAKKSERVERQRRLDNYYSIVRKKYAPEQQT